MGCFPHAPPRIFVNLCIYFTAGQSAVQKRSRPGKCLRPPLGCRRVRFRRSNASGCGQRRRDTNFARWPVCPRRKLLRGERRDFASGPFGRGRLIIWHPGPNSRRGLFPSHDIVWFHETRLCARQRAGAMGCCPQSPKADRPQRIRLGRAGKGTTSMRVLNGELRILLVQCWRVAFRIFLHHRDHCFHPFLDLADLGMHFLDEVVLNLG